MRQSRLPNEDALRAAANIETSRVWQCLDCGDMQLYDHPVPVPAYCGRCGQARRAHFRAVRDAPPTTAAAPLD